jgi:Electron transfer DM13
MVLLLSIDELTTFILTELAMKTFNQLILLGATSVLIGTASFLVSPATAEQTSPQGATQPFATVAQTGVAQTGTVAIASGDFVAGEAPTAGTARIVTEGGHRYLEFNSAFSTSDQGPDLHVLLEGVAQPPQTYQSMGSFVNLGSLSSTTGTQRYPIPDSVNLSNFRSVVIWCRMANATFGYASLQPVSNASVR